MSRFDGSAQRSRLRAANCQIQRLGTTRLAEEDLRSDRVCPPFGGGVIGNTTGSDPVIGGSSPPPRAGSEREARFRTIEK